MINEQRLVDLFLQLIRIDGTSRHEKAVADVLENELRSMGFDVVRDGAGEAIGGDTGNLIASKKGSVADAIPIMFNAHMDTVEPTSDLKVKIEAGVIRSSGDTILGADDRAGITAIIEALRTVTEQNIPHGDIQVVFSVSEEVGLCGAKHMDYSLVTSKCAFVYDMGTPVGCVTVVAPYQDSILAKITGKAAHAGADPERGVNAIVAASRAIAGMKLGRIDRETTANVGIISGGKATNIIPDYCEVKGEARSRNEDKLVAQTQHMVECFHNAASEMGADIEIDIERMYNGYRLTDDDDIVRIAVEAARRVGIEPEMHETGGGSDSNIFNALGLQASPIGVGYEGPHSVGESIPIADFAKSAQMAVEIVRVAAGS